MMFGFGDQVCMAVQACILQYFCVLGLVLASASIRAQLHLAFGTGRVHGCNDMSHSGKRAGVHGEHTGWTWVHDAPSPAICVLWGGAQLHLGGGTWGALGAWGCTGVHVGAVRRCPVEPYTQRVLASTPRTCNSARRLAPLITTLQQVDSLAERLLTTIPDIPSTPSIPSNKQAAAGVQCTCRHAAPLLVCRQRPGCLRAGVVAQLVST